MKFHKCPATGGNVSYGYCNYVGLGKANKTPLQKVSFEKHCGDCKHGKKVMEGS